MILRKEKEERANSKISLKLTIDKNFCKREYEKVLEKYSKNLKIPGFRKGQVPVNLVKSKYDSSIKAEAIENSIREAIESFFKEEEQKPLPFKQPKILNESLDFNLDEDFTINIEYEVLPKINVPDYKKLSIKVPNVTVSESDIDEELKNLQEKNAMIVDDNKAEVGEGSIITTNFVEIDESGAEIKETKREDFVFTVGESNNYYDIDRDLIGMKQNQEKMIKKDYPQDYKFKEIAGSFKTLKVLVKDIKRKDIPELDDEFAKDVSSKYNTLSQLREHIRENINEFIKNKIEEIKLESILRELKKEIKIEVPSSLLEREIENNWNSIARQSKMSLEEFKKTFGLSQDTVSEDFKRDVEESLKLKLILDAIVDSLNFAIKEEDLEEELKKQAISSSANYEDLRKYYEEHKLLPYFKEELRRKKAIEQILKDVKSVVGENITLTELFEYKVG